SANRFLLAMRRKKSRLICLSFGCTQRLAGSPRERRSADFSPQACWSAKEAMEFCGRVCAVLTFLRDKSRAHAAILVGALNTYWGVARALPQAGLRTRPWR